MWLEVLKALDTALPADSPANGDQPEHSKDAIAKRKELHITDVDCEHRANLATWYQDVQPQLLKDRASMNIAAPAAAGAPGAVGGPGAAVAPAAGVPPAVAPAAGGEAGAPTEGPTGEGWVIQLKGYHYHNGSSQKAEGAQYVRTTLVRDLMKGIVQLPVSQGTDKKHVMKGVPIADLGISYPVIISNNPNRKDHRPDPTVDADDRSREKILELDRFDFTVQFCWQETPPSKRQAKEDAAKAAAAAAAQLNQGAEPEPGAPSP